MKIALCCIAKCENLYLSEWVNYHLNLGFDHIYIYDNNDTDSERCEDIVGKENPNVTVLKYFIGKKQKGCETQIASYNDFYQRFGGKYDWVLYLDVDEFLVLNGYKNVCEYIKDITKPSTKSVRLNWKCYDDNDNLHYECLPVRERFTRVCEDETLSYYKKHFYRTKLNGFKAINVHYSNIRGDVVDCDGKYATYSTFVTSDTYNHNKAYIAHYVTKSAYEYYMIKKKRRSNGIGNDRLSIEHYFKYNKRTEEKERYLTDLFAGKVKQVDFEEKVNIIKEKPTEGISVCITAYNSQDFIEECLDSVAEQTWFKTHNNWEVIVGIDGCERTLLKMKEIMHKYKNLRVLMMDSNKGTYVTSNTIMREAKYEWLLRFDSDDIMYGNMIETLFRSRGDYDIVRFKSMDFPIKKTRITFGQLLINKNIFVKYGGYMAWECAADTEFLTRLANKAKIGIVDSVVFLRRIHDNSLIHSSVTGHNSEIRKKCVDYINSKSKTTPYIKMVVNTFKEIKQERIVVTMTSWKKRIQYVCNTVKCILENTLKPYDIIVNLSLEEFPNKEKELPNKLVKYNNDGHIHINWVNENTKAYKKILPVLDMYPNDIIICVDDDIEYPKNFIEKLYNTYKKYNYKYPITCGSYKWEGGIYSHAGAYSLFKKEFFGNYLYELYNNVVLKKGIDYMQFSDPIYTYAALLNGVKYKRVDGLDMQEYVKKSKVGSISPISNIGDKDYKDLITFEHNSIKEYISEKYKKTYVQLLNIPIIISFTTWTKRLDSVVKMLTHFKKQTLKPSKIICWLSSDEFCGEIIPDKLKPFVEENYIEVKWVTKNTYCHKRYEVFKKYNDCYVMLIDDDIYYDDDYVEKLFKFAYKNYKYVVTYYANMETYIDCINKPIKFVDYPTLKNTFLSGFCCFPPYTFPMESFKYENYRDKLTKNCDDSWIKAWLIKTNTRLVGLYKWERVPNPIKNTRDVAIYKENSKIIDGVKVKVSKFARCVKFLGIEEQVKKLFPNFDIDKSAKLNIDDILMKEKIINRAKKKGFDIDLDNPKTWCDKMQWLQLYDDKNELKTKCADKLLLHEYSIEKLGKDICVPIIEVYNSPDDINFSKLPNEFVLKCNHGYNFNILCKDKTKLSESECIANIKKWLNTPFGESNIQPHYLGINRKCYAEKMLHNDEKEEVTDYKFVCFNGKPTYLQILNDRHTKNFHLNYYDMNGNFVNICRSDVPCNPSKLDVMPVNFNLMKKYAAKLSEDFRFVRVDFYEENGIVYLGELTFTPATGYIKWTDSNIDKMFGDMIEL